LLPPPGNENTEKWLEERIKKYPDLTLDKLRKGPVVAPGLQEIAFSDLIFNTPSGKIELNCPTLNVLWGTSPLPVYNPLKGHRSTNSYPLLLMCPNQGSRIHSQFGNLRVIKLNSDTPALEISPADAESRGLDNGDRVQVYNSLGTLETVVRITGRGKTGMVVLYNGIWINEGGGGNRLTAACHTDIGYGSAFHGNSVEVVKITDR